MVRQIISRLRYFQFNSSLARKILSLYYKDGKAYRIPYGALRGYRIGYDSSIDFHVMLGMWELQNIAILTRLFTALNLTTVADVGANIGFMSLWFAKMVRGNVFAFEPVAFVAAHLQNNLSLNKIKNVSVIERACADIVGEIDFYVGFHHHVSSLNADFARGKHASAEKITVAATTLDNFFYAENHPLPDLIKMDIEGSAIFALKGCHRLLTEKRPLLFIESHTPDEDRTISDVILKYDYACYRVTNNQWVTQPQEVHPHPDGVWGTMLLCPSDMKNNILQIITS
jgi:FkbM family methyltransferase